MDWHLTEPEEVDEWDHWFPDNIIIDNQPY